MPWGWLGRYPRFHSMTAPPSKAAHSPAVTPWTKGVPPPITTTENPGNARYCSASPILSATRSAPTNPHPARALRVSLLTALTVLRKYKRNNACYLVWSAKKVTGNDGFWLLAGHRWRRCISLGCFRFESRQPQLTARLFEPLLLAFWLSLCGEKLADLQHIAGAGLGQDSSKPRGGSGKV